MSDFSLNSAIAKAARAEEHLAALHRAIDAWLETGPYVLLTTTPRPTGLRYVAEVDIKVLSVEPVPLRVSAILGDVLFNLSAALDHIAWAAVRQKGDRMTEAQAQNIYFPYRRKREHFDSDLTVGHVEPEVRNLMLAYQPFTAANVEAVERLTALRGLHRIDKHRIVHAVTGAVMPDHDPEVVGRDVKILDVIPGDRVLVPEARIATVRVAPESVGVDSTVAMELVPVEIRFGDGEDVTYSDVADMRKTITRVIDDFAPLFRP